MKSTSILFVLLVATTIATAADEVIPLLKVKDEVYTNVTVTEVTAMDIYFTSQRGMGNAKLKDLSPELQKHFHYNAAKSAQTEQARQQANAEFRKSIPQNTTKPPAGAARASTAADEDDFVAPELYAASVRGQLAPRFVVEKWITATPSTAGKFVLIDFWATWCPPCRGAIPELNAFQEKFKDRLVVIGVSDESEAAIRKLTDPKIDYAVATDTKRRMHETLKITGIPHCILIDPNGFVRYEGMPQYLDDHKLEHFLAKYGN